MPDAPRAAAARAENPWRRRAVLGLAALVVFYHLYLIWSGLIPNLISRPLHLALALPFVFIIGASGPRAWRYVGYGLAVLAIAGCCYIAWDQEALSEQYGSLEGWWQYGLAAVLILAVLEMARRAIKWALPLVAVIALCYGFFGHLIPGQMGHPGIPASSFLGTLVVAEGGLWGPLTGVSVNIVAIFVILGAVVGAGESGTAFMTLAVKLAGRYRAGAAKVSVLSSAFFGSISGSASANVASTGAITLPAMRRLGYPPAFAGAVEAVASSGGQIMPPLMGAGAFVMVELLRVPYATIMGAALLPAILFFVAAWIGVDLFARRYGLRGMAKDDIPALRYVLRLAPFFLLPFGLLLGILFLTSYTPQLAAAYAILLAAILLLVNDRWQPDLRRWGARLSSACLESARQIAAIAAIIICAGIVVGVLNQTGLGVKVTSMIIGLSGGKLWIALALTGLACLILGMEVPTTAAYVICISVAGPALQELGLPPLYAHMFVFWYALLSTITPPVCGTVFIAAGMVQSPWVPVAGHAMRLGIGLYVVPLAMIANPALIQLETTVLLAVLAFFKIAIGLFMMSGAAIASAPVWQRLGLLAAGGAVIFLLGVGRFPAAG